VSITWDAGCIFSACLEICFVCISVARDSNQLDKDIFGAMRFMFQFACYRLVMVSLLILQFQLHILDSPL
jgi:hypothetical protein